ncbi:hypothetical protein MATL_G00022140 [Megalops atlanticus]|uniref:SH2 domain-containing protein n=1 Tax=Megalops atlanticus TaxID=7932 RepID=A0A9D3QBC2_MEGAT|nr:hypothetical protein MATL_G00022140 [Megalops atlanticus]
MDLPMYHGAISREACEELLSKKGKDGSFLIRDSETIQGALCLCVYKQSVVYTYRILQTHSGYYTLQGERPGPGDPLRYPVKRRMQSLPRTPDDTSAYENVVAVTKHGPVLPP